MGGPHRAKMPRSSGRYRDIGGEMGGNEGETGMIHTQAGPAGEDSRWLLYNPSSGPARACHLLPVFSRALETFTPVQAPTVVGRRSSLLPLVHLRRKSVVCAFAPGHAAAWSNWD